MMVCQDRLGTKKRQENPKGEKSKKQPFLSPDLRREAVRRRDVVRGLNGLVGGVEGKP